MFDGEELKRYNRQLIVPELGIDGQRKLKQSKVLMVGAGGLGCPVLQYLTAAGVGTIGIVDNDVVELSNLHRQILYSDNDIGINKAIVARQKLQILNPHVHINAYPERLTGENAYNIIQNYDIIIDGSDNYLTRYLVNDNCVTLGKTLVFGSIFRFEGQVSVLNHQNSPNYRDLYPEAPDAHETPNCADIGVIGVLPGIVGNIMANETIKIICHIGEILSGKLLIWNALDSTMKTFSYGSAQNKAELFSNNNQPAPENISSTTTTEEIDRDQLRIWCQETPQQVILIDVRDNYEYEASNIGGVNIPLYALTDSIDTIPIDKRIVFCCQNGYKSKHAMMLFKGITQRRCYHLKGGISTE